VNGTAQPDRLLAVVSSKAVRNRLLGLLGPNAEGLRWSEWRRPEFALQPMLWLDHSQLMPPAVADHSAHEDWQRIVHLLAPRTFVEVEIIDDDAPASEIQSWRDRFAQQVEPEIQAQANRISHVVILVFARVPDPAELKALLARMENAAVYLMMPQLRVDPDSPRLALAKGVWAEAVIRLLARLRAPAPPSPGLYAWRALELRDSERQEREDRQVAEETRKFVDWLRQARERSDDLDKLPSHSLNQPNELDLPATDESKRRLNEFDFSSDTGVGSAVDCVMKIARPESCEVHARQAGVAWRKAQTVHSAALLRIEELQRVRWRRFADSVPPEGGPGLPEAFAASLLKAYSRCAVPQRLIAQVEQWKRSFELDADFEQASEQVESMAGELQQARDGLVRLEVRWWLGMLCFVILAFILAQATDAWAGVWSSGNWREMTQRQVVCLVIFLVAAAGGVVAGVLGSYWLERARGKRAGRELCSQASGLQNRMASRLYERLLLCHQARSLALDADHAVGCLHGQRVVNRAGEVLRPALRPPEIDVRESDIQRQRTARSPDSNIDATTYHGLSTLEVSLLEPEDAVRNPDAGEIERMYKRAYQQWKSRACKLDPKCNGWVAQTTFPALVHDTIARFQQEYRDYLHQRWHSLVQTFEPDASVVERLRHRFERWEHSDRKATEAVPMLSCHVDHYGLDPEPSVFIISRTDVLARPVQTQAPAHTLTVPSVGDPLWPLQILARVIEEYPIEFTEGNVATEGRAWFRLGEKPGSLDGSHAARNPD